MKRESERLALIGAFPFPHPQGSQVFVALQARALAAAGAAPVLLSYGQGDGAIPGRGFTGLDLVRSPAWLSPRGRRSGPSAAKPLADAALTVTYARAHRRLHFDCAFAHNAEAAVVAILARPLVGVPVVYVAHTILRHELSAYAPPRLAPALDRIGAGLDRWIAARADGIVALSDDAQQELAPHARGPVRVIPPGLDPDPAPEKGEIAAACRHAGVEPGAFVLYTGNLDGYQDLSLLTDAAERLSVPVLVATHDERASNPKVARRLARGALRIHQLRDFAQGRALAFGAKALVLTRRRPGGFPIKLLNYMETARPIVAFQGIAPTLEDGVSARLLDPQGGAAELAEALHEIHEDPSLAARLGAEARKTLEHHHAWPRIANQTLDLAHELKAER